MRRFYSPRENINSSTVILSGDEVHHLRDVLRLHCGDEVLVFDGLGTEYLCRIDKTDKHSAILMVEREIKPASPESPCAITLGLSILKHDKFDLVVQKAVELGVVRVVPLTTARSENWRTGIEKKLVRLRRIAIDATKQCGRARLMMIEPPISLQDFFTSSPSDESILFFTERSGASIEGIHKTKSVTAVVGPEGGWDDTEIKMAEANGFYPVTLGGRIMRAETAAISITAILQNRFGDLS